MEHALGHIKRPNLQIRAQKEKKLEGKGIENIFNKIISFLTLEKEMPYKHKRPTEQ